MKTPLFNRLDSDKSFQGQLWPFFLPYALYVSIGSLPDAWMRPETNQLIKLLVVGSVMVFYSRRYQPGRFSGRDLGISLPGALVALLLWVAPLLLISGAKAPVEGGGAAQWSAVYVVLRGINSVLLVAVFEELFLRVYLTQWVYQASRRNDQKNRLDAFLDTWSQKPMALPRLPLNRISVTATTILFAAGHGMQEWVSAIFYFLWTSYLYHKTQSLWVCILVHALTNLGVLLLVRFGGMTFLW